MADVNPPPDPANGGMARFYRWMLGVALTVLVVAGAGWMSSMQAHHAALSTVAALQGERMARSEEHMRAQDAQLEELHKQFSILLLKLDRLIEQSGRGR